MLKKSLLALFLVTLIMTGAFAQVQMSAGGGLSYTSAFDGGYKVSVPDYESEENEMPYMGISIFGFFDIKFVELSFSYFFGEINFKKTGPQKGNSVDFNIVSYNIGLLGKYPVQLGEKFTIFPAVGFEGYIVESARSGSVSISDALDFSHLWIKFGAGFDISFNEKIFLRATALYGIRLPCKVEDDLIALEKAALALTGIKATVDPIMGHGFQVKLAVGFHP